MSDPTTLGPFLGINNKLPVDKLRIPATDNRPAATYVRDAVNVDLTESGTFQRRGGATLAVATTRASSLWATVPRSGITGASVGYFCDAGFIKSFDGTNVVTIAQMAAPNAVADFTDTPIGPVWTDGITLQNIVNGVSSPLTSPIPNPVPLVTVGTGGNMAAGTYILAFANRNAATGLRSPITGYQQVTVAAGGKLSFTLASSTYIVDVFVSALGGSDLYRELSIPAGTTSATLAEVLSTGTFVSQEYEAPMPAGTWVRYYRGRLLTVVGNMIFYSQPYSLGTYYPAKGYIALDDTVTLCKPTQEGVFLATRENTWFLDGLDVATAVLKPIAPYGAIPGTDVDDPKDLNAYWMTPRGIVHTTDSNTLDMKQNEAVAFGDSTAGASLYREVNGLTQVITTLSNSSSVPGASATSYMSATTVN